MMKNAPQLAEASKLYSMERIYQETIASEADGRLDEEALLRVKAFCRSVNVVAEESNTIVFVANLPYFMIAREALGLKEKGYRIFLLTYRTLPPPQMKFFGKIFDGIQDANGSHYLMGQLIKQLEPDIFHVQCWMKGYQTGRLAIENKGRAICVCEFYDVTSVVHDYDTLSAMMRSEEYDLDCFYEEFIFQKADGIIHRLADHLSSKVRDRYASTRPMLEFEPYPCDDFISYAPVQGKCDLENLRFVFVGGLHPIDEKHTESPHILLYDMFKILLGQGISIDIYHDPNREIFREEAGYRPYFELMDQHEGFHIRSGVLPDQLSALISGYDFGIVLLDFTEQGLYDRRNTLKGSIGTKVFSFLEAGLPFLISAEAEYTAKFAIEHGVGIPLNFSDRRNVKQAISHYDYTELVENVHTYNRKNNMGERIVELIELYEAAGAKR